MSKVTLRKLLRRLDRLESQVASKRELHQMRDELLRAIIHTQPTPADWPYVQLGLDEEAPAVQQVPLAEPLAPTEAERQP